MSWLEKTKTNLSITTGDGKVFTPLWTPLDKEIAYNLAVYEFPKIGGALVRRYEQKANRYDIEFYFQGDDHLDQAAAFELSAADKRPWTISHPFEGSMLAHPIGFKKTNRGLNVTVYTGSVMETITEDAPKATVNPSDKILSDKDVADSLMASSYVAEVRPKAVDLKEMGTKTKSTFDLGKKGINSVIDSQDYLNAFNDANRAIDNAVAEPLLAIRQIQLMINAPINFLSNVQSRMATLKSQFVALTNSLDTILSRNSKKLYENNAGTLLSAMAAASVTNAQYGNRRAALDMIAILVEQYSSYINALDVLQSTSGAEIDAYIPDAEGMIFLSNLISYTVSALILIATDARQERTFILEEDDTLFTLAKRLYGLKEDDSTIDELIETNALTMQELLIIPKGRTIKYYV